MTTSSLSSSSFNPDPAPLSSSLFGSPATLPEAMVAEISQAENVAKSALLSATVTAEPVSPDVKPPVAKDITKEVADVKRKNPEEIKKENDRIKEDKARLAAAHERLVLAAALTTLAVGTLVIGLGVTLAFPPAGIGLMGLSFCLAVGAVEAMKPRDPEKKNEEAHKSHKDDNSRIEEPERKRRKVDDPFSIEMTELPARPEARDPDEPPTSRKKTP